jgi:hypothetical protein
MKTAGYLAHGECSVKTTFSQLERNTLMVVIMHADQIDRVRTWP